MITDLEAVSSASGTNVRIYWIDFTLYSLTIAWKDVYSKAMDVELW